MTTVADLRRQIEEREKSVEPFPWEVETVQLQERQEALKQRLDELKDDASKAANHAGRIAAQIRQHEQRLLTIPLDEVPAWADETARLVDHLQAYKDRASMLQPLITAAERAYRESLESKAPQMVKRAHIRRLRSILASDAPQSEKTKAYRELEKIDEAMRPRVEHILPPGFDLTRYVNGMRID